MTPSQDVPPFKSPQQSHLESTIVLPKRRQSPQSSLASLPYRRSNTSLQTLFASTSTLPTGYSTTGTATPTGSVIPASVFSPGSRQNGTQSPFNPPPDVRDEPRNLIIRAFVPHVAITASTDTEEIVRAKGFEGGLLQLLRPFGESVPGKVTIRDSVGASRSWEDFGVRFTAITDGSYPTPIRRSTESGTNGEDGRVRLSRTGGDITQIEETVDRHLQYSEYQSHDLVTDYLNHKNVSSRAENSTSPFYTLYLRRLLSGLPMQAHETFAHPVACIIAISSRTPDPIEELRRLYARTHSGDLKLPPFVNNEYLRYYVLVHDEEHGEIAKSNQLFEQMKRHFGLHCHLLRLKSNQCIPSDDDSVRLPICEWISAAEELAEIQKQEAADDIEDPTPYLFDSDVTAIRTFVRELVTQSVIPYMERNVAQWNEQILARRRGISGRFMSLSKRWTTFGSSRSSSSPTTSSSSSNYENGIYRPESPEALMRKLADFAFMLRDFKLSLQTYDLLRTDFNNDKAWLHAAGASEMATVSALLSTQPLASKTRIDNIDTWLEASIFNYLNRQRAPYYALRSLTLSLELLKLRGASAASDAARWAIKVLELNVFGPVSTALFTERVSACYSAKEGIGSISLGSRRRKAAFWSILATEAWLDVDKSIQAEKNLDAACRFYGIHQEGTRLPFEGMQVLVNGLRQVTLEKRLANRGFEDEHEHEAQQTEEQELLVEEVSETLDTMDPSPRLHRKSLIGSAVPPIEVGPLSPVRDRDEEKRDDQFE